MTWQTQWVLTNHFPLSPFTGFVFFATLLLYAVHRLVSLQKLTLDNQQKGRFSIILPYRFLLRALSIFALILVATLYLQLSTPLQIALLLPIILAAGYALPILPNGKRLRDVGYLKNLLIAGVWTWVTLIVPVLELKIPLSLSILIMAAGRFFFIFALSLPFDIRDLTLDQRAGVRTIPATIGIAATKKLGIALNVLFFCCAGMNWLLSIYTFGDWLAIGISILVSNILIGFASSKNSDFYFAGLLDGVMILQFLLVWLL